MPIQKQQVGKNDTTNILFGTGDIQVVTCRASGKEQLTQLWLCQHTEKPESEWNKNTVDVNSDSDQLTSGAVVLEFTKTKSIDQLIDALIEIKASMDYRSLPLPTEQKLVTKTQCHFDLWDRLKLLFGMTLEVETIFSIPTKMEIGMYNGHSKIHMLRNSKSAFIQDKPGYGYTEQLSTENEPINSRRV